MYTIPKMTKRPRDIIQSWLTSTPDGQRLAARFQEAVDVDSSSSSDLCDGSNSETEAEATFVETIKAVFGWHSDNSYDVQLPVRERDGDDEAVRFPREVREVMFGDACVDEEADPRSESEWERARRRRRARVLCSDATLARLARRGRGTERGCVEVMLGAWVERKYQGDEWAYTEALDDMRLLARGFRQKFQGDGVAWIERALVGYKGMYDPAAHWGRLVPLVQSSATGKSRLIAEWGTKRLVLCVSFGDIGAREVHPKNGWPPGDRPACRFFCAPPVPRDRSLRWTGYKGEELTAAFLGALFEVAAELAERESSVAGFNKHWVLDDFLDVEDSRRFVAFESVVQRATDALEAKEQEIDEARPAEVYSVDVDSYTEPPAEEVTDWCKNLFRLFVEKPAKRLTEVCTTKADTLGGPGFILAFDECTQLNKIAEVRKATRSYMTRSYERPYVWDVMSVPALQRMIKACEDVDVWTFILDTNLDLQPKDSGSGSEMETKAYSGLQPLPVYPYIPFDVMVRDARRARTPADALKLEYLKIYGRPYWSTLPNSMLVDCAIPKILCARRSNFFYTDQVLAIFSARLLLELGTNEEAQELAVEGVRRHMRVLTGVTSDGAVITRVPSEPMLAIAASAILLKDEDLYGSSMRTFIGWLVRGDIILQKGRHGALRLFARIILTLSRDAAVGKALLEGARGKAEVPTFTLARFLGALIGEDVFSEVEDEACRSAQREVHQALMRWADAYRANFTHFAPLDTTVYELSQEVLIECWRRGTALVCADGQACFDIIIVVYKGSMAEFEPGGFSLVVIQVKNRSAPPPAMYGTSIDHLTCPKLVDDAGKRWKPQHFVVVMDLETTAPFDAGGYVRLACKKAEHPHAVGANARSNAWEGYLSVDEEPERYSVEIRDHTSEQYPSLGKFAMNSWARLWTENRMPVLPRINSLAEDHDVRKTLNPLEKLF